MASFELTADRLRAALHYDPNTGQFTHLVATSKTAIGDVAGCAHSAGYRKYSIAHCTYTGHRLAWLYVHGKWPVAQIDHINGDRTDNRICNLREADATLNAQNRHVAAKRNKSGFIGVASPNGKRKTYRVSITTRGVGKHIGVFSTAEEARECYIAAKRELHPGSTL